MARTERETDRAGYAQRFGARLRELRLAAGMSQTELARLVGLAQPRVQEHEAGTYVPSTQTAERYSLALGVSLAAFDGLDKKSEEKSGAG
jgi:transcriptional regulator with XRE-family HTH domain